MKRCTSVNERKNSGSRWALNNNITRAQTVWVSWRQDAELRASGRQRALGPQWPTVEQPSQDEKEVLLGQYSSQSLSPAHLSHTTNINPFENKEWEIYFYKEVCSFVHWSSSLFLTMFLLKCLCIHAVVLWIYNIDIWTQTYKLLRSAALTADWLSSHFCREINTKIGSNKKSRNRWRDREYMTDREKRLKK